MIHGVDQLVGLFFSDIFISEYLVKNEIKISKKNLQAFL